MIWEHFYNRVMFMFVIGILILWERVQTRANVACRSLSACDLCVSFPVSICGL